MIFLKDIPIISNGIFIYQLETKKDFKEYYQNIEYNDTYNNDNLVSISKKMSVLNELEDLKLEIDNCCNHFIKNILSMNCSFNIFNSWFTKTKPSGFSDSHVHSNSWFSGCFYPEHNKDFNIKFYNDNLFAFKDDINNFGIYNSRDWIINPQKNQLILFFSTLRHEICQNKSEQDRYSLAFNVLPNGIFGVGDSKVNFQI
tara:strand:+ start:54 stop:653 length:600 start_codon:yes stop_codon:yes gene_type:complete